MMLASSPRHSGRTLILVISVSFLLAILYYNNSAGLGRIQRLRSPSTVADDGVTKPDGGFPSAKLARFWQDLVEEMTRCQPAAKTIELNDKPDERDLDVNAVDPAHRHVTDLIHMSKEDVHGLRQAHERFKAKVGRLATKLPIETGSRGIVMTAGGPYVGMAMTALLMLRRSGSKLPVQLFVDSVDKSVRTLCEGDLRSLGAECLTIDDLGKTTPTIPKPEKYQFKVLALLSTTFEHVLFLDADAFPIRNPDFLFHTKPYLSHGLVTWPDFWLPSISPLFYEITDTPTPPLTTHMSSESGVMMFNRRTHAKSLILAAYYNYYGPGFYYPLLTQRGPGEGDKETFLQAAEVLKQPHWDVKTPLKITGRWYNGTFDSAGMKQANPLEDYHIHEHEPVTITPAIHEEELKNKTAATWLFVHHNLVKIDARRMIHSLERLFQKTEDGRYMRLWGHDDELIELAGYDVEKALWEEIIATNCGGSLLEDCEKMREYYRGVFLDESVE